MVTVGHVVVSILTQIPTIRASVVLTPGQLITFFGRSSLSIIVVAWMLAADCVVNHVVAAVEDERTRFDFTPVLSNVWTLVVLVGTVGVAEDAPTDTVPGDASAGGKRVDPGQDGTGRNGCAEPA